MAMEPDKPGGKPCLLAVYDVLGWLASGMAIPAILEDFPERTEADIRADLAFAADRGFVLAKPWVNP